MPASTIVELPKQTFLENLVLRGGEILFTSHEDGRLMSVRPGAAPTLLATLPGKITGIASGDAGGVVLTGFSPEGRAVIRVLDAASRPMHTDELADAVFLNGIERISADVYLVADS